MAPQSSNKDRWATWFYYTQGSEAFRGDLYFYSLDHEWRFTHVNAAAERVLLRSREELLGQEINLAKLTDSSGT